MMQPPTTSTEWKKQTKDGYSLLSARIDSKSGSSWGHDKLLTFRVLHIKKKSDYPDFLNAYISDAERTLHKSPHFQQTVRLLETGGHWQTLDPREDSGQFLRTVPPN